MDFNFFILIFLVELAIFLLIIFLIVKLDCRIKARTAYIKSHYKPHLYLISDARSALKSFNAAFDKVFTPKPFDRRELSCFCTDLLKDGFTFLRASGGIAGKVNILRILAKLFKNKGRITVTLSNGIKR